MSSKMCCTKKTDMQKQKVCEKKSVQKTKTKTKRKKKESNDNNNENRKLIIFLQEVVRPASLTRLLPSITTVASISIPARSTLNACTPPQYQTEQKTKNRGRR
uniref:Uncharacterized protein n=1 Tax=Trypanosoma vivax (strain Y486) TaxID=1055687 RepID=G0TRG5_TRYVY|nr:hypothetical protein, unlikely [Trypanosoma vivax Y486]